MYKFIIREGSGWAVYYKIDNRVIRNNDQLVINIENKFSYNAVVVETYNDYNKKTHLLLNIFGIEAIINETEFHKITACFNDVLRDELAAAAKKEADEKEIIMLKKQAEKIAEKIKELEK